VTLGMNFLFWHDTFEMLCLGAVKGIFTHYLGNFGWNLLKAKLYRGGSPKKGLAIDVR
jgi:hypothetical protein